MTETTATVTEGPISTVTYTDGPTAESGYSTSEWRAAVGAVVGNTLALAVAFGVHISPAQQTAILAWVTSTTALVALYSVSRGIRKRGTTS